MKTYSFKKSKRVTRRVVIEAPAQQVRGKKKELQVKAGRAPAGTIPPPPKEKRIRFYHFVMNLRVYPENSQREIFSFNPPLRIVVESNPAQFYDAPRDQTGLPRLSIITAYRDRSRVWHWEKLPTRRTRVSAKKILLTASIKTLHPQDPIIEGF